MRQQPPGLVRAFGLLLLLVSTFAGSASAFSQTPLETMLAERALGSDEAPVTIVEYSSLTCPHCAEFHADTLPKIKETYIDTGKVRLVFEDFPLGSLALGAAVVARCLPEERYFGFLDYLFRTQATWSRSQQPLQSLERMARFGGLSGGEFQSCVNNGDLVQGIQRRAQKASQDHDIESTPTFLINDERVIGAQSFETFQQAIEAALEKAN